MTEGVLTPERILEAAEDVLRRYGPAKTTVVDVARALGVSHGAVYRHFPSKAALRDAVTERWLARLGDPARGRRREEGPSPKRHPSLARAADRGEAQKALEDPELFATYVALAADSRGGAAHVSTSSGNCGGSSMTESERRARRVGPGHGRACGL